MGAVHFWGGKLLATRGHCRIGTLAPATGWSPACTVAARWVAVALDYIRPYTRREERCQGGVAGGVPRTREGRNGPTAQTAVVSVQELKGRCRGYTNLYSSFGLCPHALAFAHYGLMLHCG